MVSDAYRFDAVGSSFVRFMVQHADKSDVPIHHIILVGHNSRVFDVPFLAQHLINYKIDEEFFGFTILPLFHHLNSKNFFHTIIEGGRREYLD
jgi:hypothetical protein